ncbi:MAG: hypothetical protein LBP40_02550 [Campylobacteraceae bacterium]|nr:hypothetical protein [Campylobacteraceae bacterium]
MKKNTKFISKTRTISNNIEEFIGQIFLWFFVAAAFVLMQGFFSTFLHLIFYLPLCIILSIPLGFSVTIGIIAIMNICKNALKKK